MARVLCVAEKHDAAKTIAAILSHGHMNKVYIDFLSAAFWIGLA